MRTVNATSSAEHENVTRETLHSSFLSAKEAVNLLLRSEKALQHIPQGRKNNVYFIIENSNNFETRGPRWPWIAHLIF